MRLNFERITPHCPFTVVILRKHQNFSILNCLRDVCINSHVEGRFELVRLGVIVCGNTSSVWRFGMFVWNRYSGLGSRQKMCTRFLAGSLTSRIPHSATEKPQQRVVSCCEWALTMSAFLHSDLL